jgi:hypothetical protein
MLVERKFDRFSATIMARIRAGVCNPGWPAQTFDFSEKSNVFPHGQTTSPAHLL